MLQPEWTVTVALNYIPKSKMFFQNNNITKMGNNFCVCLCLTLFIKKIYRIGLQCAHWWTWISLFTVGKIVSIAINRRYQDLDYFCYLCRE